jgi:hypothetical protein
MTVRRADVGDEALVRALRIAALTDVPHAFGSTLEREKARTPDDWRRWFSPGVTYVHVDENGVGAGLVAGILDEERSLAHLVALYERHGFRRTGNVSVRVDGVREVEMERNAS